MSSLVGYKSMVSSNLSIKYFWSGLLATALLLGTVILRVSGYLTVGDEIVGGWAGALPSRLLPFFSVITYAGGSVAAFLLTFVAALWLCKRRGYKPAFILAGAVLATRILVYLLKENLALPRPDVSLSGAESFGFPSGHASFIVSFLAALYILGGFARTRFYAVFFVCAALLVCVSRIILGEHFTSDVIGGILSGLLVPAFLLAWYESSVNDRERREF